MLWLWVKEANFSGIVTIKARKRQLLCINKKLPCSQARATASVPEIQRLNGMQQPEATSTTKMS